MLYNVYVLFKASVASEMKINELYLTNYRVTAMSQSYNYRTGRIAFDLP